MIPADQSEDAKVFGYIVPNFKELTSLEQLTCGVPAKRIYDSISVTWPEASILTEEPAAIGATGPACLSRRRSGLGVSHPSLTQRKCGRDFSSES